MPGHPRSELEKALRIPALSGGLRGSFQALLEREQSGVVVTGNPGLTAAAGPSPAWTGFRSLLVARRSRESSNVTSLILEPADGPPLQAALPGQFIVLRLKPSPDAPTLLRSYSLSGEPSADRYRISVKRETHGAVGAYIDAEVRVGDVLEASAPRGNFTLGPGGGPVILLSAGIGATPVLAILHALAATASRARSGESTAPATAASIRLLPRRAPCSRYYLAGIITLCYSASGPADRPSVDFDTTGRLGMPLLRELGVPRDADFYLCGPTAFMSELTAELAAWGRYPPYRHRNFRLGPLKDTSVAEAARWPPHLPDGQVGTSPLVSFARSGINVHWDLSMQSLLELAEACDVPVRWSCRTGVCHRYETGLIGGTVAYRPDPVEPPADGNVLICCSQPTGDIVVDL
jgi:ferredoxin-NADP reductase